MSNRRDVVVLSGVRTAIGDYGGALKELGATELGAIAVRVRAGDSLVESFPAACLFGINACIVARVPQA